jgi:hypothetical protein
MKLHHLILAAALAAIAATAGPAQAQTIAGPRLHQSTRSLQFTSPGEQGSIGVSNRGAAVLRLNQVRLLSETARSDFGFRPIGPQAVRPGQSITYTVSFRPVRPLGGPGQPRQSFAALQFVTDDASLAADTGRDRSGFVAGVGLKVSADPPLLSWIVLFPLLGIPLVLLVPAGTTTRQATWSPAKSRGSSRSNSSRPTP